MKKQNQSCLMAGRKLSLNKTTISNLTAAEMNRQVGGGRTKGHTCAYTCGGGGYTNRTCAVVCW